MIDEIKELTVRKREYGGPQSFSMPFETGAVGDVVQPVAIARILLIDDNASDVELLRFALSEAKLDCELLVIGDGAEALAFVRQQGSYARSGVPDLIVLDLHLPKSDGIEILEAVTHSPPFADVPVTIFSSGFTPREIVRLRQFHVAHSIAKSSSLDEFLQIGSTLKRLLSETRTNG